MLVNYFEKLYEPGYIVMKSSHNNRLVTLGYDCFIYYNDPKKIMSFSIIDYIGVPCYLLTNKSEKDFGINSPEHIIPVLDGDLVLLGFSENTILYGIIVESDKIYTDYKPLTDIYNTSFIVLRNLNDEEKLIRNKLIKKYKSNVFIDEYKVFKDILGRKINKGDKIFCRNMSFYMSCFSCVDDTCYLKLSSGLPVSFNSEQNAYNLFKWSPNKHLPLLCYKIDDETYNKCTEFHCTKRKWPEPNKDIFSNTLYMGDMVIIDYNSRNIEYGLLVAPNEYFMESGKVKHFRAVIKRDKNNFTIQEKNIYKRLVDKYQRYAYCEIKAFDKMEQKELGDVFLLKNNNCGIYLGKYKFLNQNNSSYNFPTSYTDKNNFDLYLILNMEKKKDYSLYTSFEKGIGTMDDVIKFINSKSMTKKYIGNSVYVEPNSLNTYIDNKIVNKLGNVKIIGLGNNIQCYFNRFELYLNYIAQ